jgi:uncharacterized protein with HEPN domain
VTDVKKGDRVYLEHILGAVRRIEEYTSSGREPFFQTPMIQDAVMRNLEIIGEAVKQLSPDLRARCSSVPWSRIAGMRDVLIHQYFGVDLGTVWNTVERRLSELKRAVASLLGELPP